MIELLVLLVFGAVFGAAGGIIATTIALGAVWLVLTVDRAARR